MTSLTNEILRLADYDKSISLGLKPTVYESDLEALAEENGVSFDDVYAIITAKGILISD